MSMRPAVFANNTTSALRRGRRLARVALLCLLPLLLVRVAQGDELLIAEMVLNHQPRGEFFFILRTDGELLLPSDDFRALGLQPPAETFLLQGEEYVSLSAVPDLAVTFDERTLTVLVTAAPELLPAVSLDLGAARSHSVLYPHDNSFFLNYGLDYRAEGDTLDFQGLSLSNEFGLRLGGNLLLSDTLYTQTPHDSHFVRLNTALIHDHRPTMHRFTAGDFFAASGELGSRTHLGGLSFAKVYRIDPYFIRYPLFDFSGMLALPSDVELLLDGVRVRSERLDPGAFDLRNFQSIGGARTVEIVIRDPFGREERFTAPFYFTDQLLRQGLHEYSYNLGWQRRNFGRASNRYGDPAFSAFHRFGLSDALNLGLRGEGSAEVINLGAESALRLSHFGILRLEAAGSRHEGRSGWAQLLSYDYSSRSWRGRLGIQSFTSDYRTLGDLDLTRQRKLNLRAGLGYLTSRYGSFSADYLHTAFHGEQDRTTLALNWSRRVWRGSYLNVTLRQVREATTANEAMVNFTYYIGRGTSVAAGYRREGDANVQMLEARRNTPAGLGTGWSVRGERREKDGTENSRLQALAQHNAPRATLRGEYGLGRLNGFTDQQLRLSVAGALVRLGGVTALTRPVHDSFALVKVADLEGVGVLAHGQTVARTDARGLAVIPNLTSYYENRLAIDDRDLPLDYLVPQVRLLVSPSLRSGSCFTFSLARYQAFTGTLSLADADGPRPLANADVTLYSEEGILRFWTGGGGEFYFDNEQLKGDGNGRQGCNTFGMAGDSLLAAGVYPVEVRQGQNRFRAELTLPASGETFVEMGEVVWPAPDVAAILSLPLSARAGADAAPQASAPDADPANHRETQSAMPVPEEEPRDHPTSASGSWVLYFPFGQATLLPHSVPVLELAADHLRSHPGAELVIEGYACQTGNPDYNLHLGLLRAKTVQSLLVETGVPIESIREVVSYGEHRPVCPELAETCLRQNRRAVILSTDARQP